MTVPAGAYASAGSLPAGFSRATLREMPLPRRVLVSPPDFFDVVDVKNPFMEGQIGRVDKAEARRQWDALCETFRRAGLAVDVVPATPGCEDMVFTANQTFPGLDPAGNRVCLLSHMRHPSRRREVPAFAAWFSAHGYAVEDPVPPELRFEGCGDALWHPGRGLIWGGFGERTERAVYPHLAKRFDVPVLTLELSVEPFYHLDTCFCALDERTALCLPSAFTPEGLSLIRRVFDDVIEVDREEASRAMACNAAAFAGRRVVIQKGAERTVGALRSRGFTVAEVETGEFLKSGGSVFCLKMGVF